MSPFTLLALLSLAGVVALFLALALFLSAITGALETIGGEAKVYGARASFLSKIRLGVRAIEVQTGYIAPQVTRLNATLAAVRDGVVAVDANLAALVASVAKQEAR